MVLYIVATPIGNLGDITFRAVEILNTVDLIACEDTRTSKKLLSHYNIRTPLTCYHDFSSDSRREEILSQLHLGKNIAIISDAGTPLVADPGYKLVRSWLDLGGKVCTVPGACAAISALVVSGLPSNNFCFYGFLPNKASGRTALWQKIKQRSNETAIIYESPHRLVATLEDLASTMPDSSIAVARELTKLFESCISGSPEKVLSHFKEYPEQCKGEIVILISPAEPRVASNEEIDQLAMPLLKAFSLSQVAEIVSLQLGKGKREVYQYLLAKNQKN